MTRTQQSIKRSFLIAGFSCVSFLVLTTVVGAQTTATAGAQAGLGTFAGLITTFNNTVVKALGTLFMSAGVIAFFFGIVQYIWGLRQGDTNKVSIGNQFMVWGLVALFVMFSVYGIIKFFQGALLPSGSNTITIPDINFGGTGSTGAGTGGTGAPGLPAVGGVVCAPPGSSCIQSSGSAGICNASNVCGPVSGGASGAPAGIVLPGTAGYSCSPGYDCRMSDGQTGLCNQAGNNCTSNAINQGNSGASGQPLPGTVGYSCSPNAQCRMSDGGEGLCNSAGNDCVSNAISPIPPTPGGM